MPTAYESLYAWIHAAFGQAPFTTVSFRETFPSPAPAKVLSDLRRLGYLQPVGGGGGRAGFPPRLPPPPPPRPAHRPPGLEGLLPRLGREGRRRGRAGDPLRRGPRPPAGRAGPLGGPRGRPGRAPPRGLRIRRRPALPLRARDPDPPRRARTGRPMRPRDLERERACFALLRALVGRGAALG